MIVKGILDPDDACDRSDLDVVRMLALGADATMVGRVFVYVLAASGAAGVDQLLRAKMRVAMALMGTRSVSEVSRDCLL
jgi:L-lactate dehydrogenase (cytochrome)